MIDFNDFLGTLPHKHKIIIAGNHDFCFEKDSAEARACLTNCTYLEDEEVTVEGIKIYGSPWQPWFFNWAFNLKRGLELRKKWDLIPSDTDILVTHGPPFGYLDKTLRGEEVGCVDLREVVEEIRPKYHIFGHIHEAVGQDSNKHTQFINASICNLRNEPVNSPVIIDYEHR